MFEKFFEQYESEEHEVIVIIGNSRGYPTKNADTNIYEISIKIMAMLFCDSGELVPKSMWIDMPLAEEECDNDALRERFEPDKLFRVKVRKMKKECQDLSSTHKWCISQVLNENEECPVLSNLLDEYYKDDVIKDEVLGELKFNRFGGVLASDLNWCNMLIAFQLRVDALDRKSWPQAISLAKTMVADCKSWDKKMRKYAASMFTEDGNKFLEDMFHYEYGDEYDEYGNHVSGETPQRVTERQFASALYICLLEINADGYFYAILKSRKYLGGKTIEVEGNVNTGIYSADIDIF
ncbi:DUF7021 domain-containing protein [Anaerobiospirillum succiniciproducens]|uniref:DUF7021 domain-containing protein n=1 Tax=Anaerobiospirillum succiniciproducens TaxID=13335 RepID=UPI0029436A79|nr:DUF2262 domain-containing protein [Anaerobiospirillum succiniciproducens]